MKLLEKLEMLNTPLIGFAGFSGSGKSTLIERLMVSLSGQGFRVGYLKHDGHQFEVDTPGKDSFIIRAAGANPVLISSAEQFALMGSSGNFTLIEEFRHCHFVIVEGHKESKIKKFLVAKDSQIPTVDPATIVGTIGRNQQSCDYLKQQLPGPPNFLSEDLEEIEHQLLHTIFSQSPMIVPVVMVGGESRRMGVPKDLVQIDGVPLLARTIKVVQQAFGGEQKVIVSLRREQMQGEREAIINDLEGVPCFDRIVGFGPAGGVASVLMEHQGVMPLFFPSDMPLLTPEFITTFTQLVDPIEFATTIYSPIFAKKGEHGAINPLVAAYHPKIIAPLLLAIAKGDLSLRKILSTVNIKQVGDQELEEELVELTRSFNSINELENIIDASRVSIAK
ncbi:MAG: molybdopterin-guanine dinucleotide biosynthesis protein B [Bdellovibrionales bacterium]|nr:molybdopterin-guanine dinucleotide biosynthesis protein B [Bdellovibrionales bacterium]MBT3524852.1 molybdopterin-guanine dinucleotide biosynthesis protein B [Bdellovibrionales bacterium]MBT7767215.1 molybdopterin-guanine dinucleotide biosynthesis protein B [Bdellovibrionales bacterium]